MAAAELQTQIGMWLHGLDVAHDVVTRVGQFNNESTVLFVTRCIWIRLGHDDCNISNAG